MKKTKVSVKKAAVKPEYEAVLEFDNKVMSATGDSLFECFEKLHPGLIFKGKAILTMKRGPISKTRVMYPPLMRRFIANPIYRKILSKSLGLQ